MACLPNNLKNLRKQNNYSQDELAEKLFVTHQTISNHETGKSEPSIKIIQKYAEFYNVDFNDLIHKDISKKEKDSKIIFDSVVFDTKDKTMSIVDGAKGTYNYRKIKKCSILNEQANYRGKTKPFTHQVISGVTVLSPLGEPSFYVGLKLVLNDDSILAIYVSKTPVGFNTSNHHKDTEQAKEIKDFIDKVIRKYNSKKVFDSVIFDKRDKTMIILDGTKGTYDYRDIVECKILNEAVNYKGKGEPFKHTVLRGSIQTGIFFQPLYYVGLRITLKDGRILGIYVSKKKVLHGTDRDRQDYTKAEEIKHFIDIAIKKYQSQEE